MCDKKQNRTISWNGQSRNHCGRLIIISYTPKLTACVWAERGPQVFCLLHNFFFKWWNANYYWYKTNHPNTWGVERLRGRGDLTVGTRVLWVLGYWHVRCLGLWDLKTRTAEQRAHCSSPWVLASSQIAASVQLGFLVAQGSKYSVQGNRAKTSSPFMT